MIANDFIFSFFLTEFLIVYSTSESLDTKMYQYLNFYKFDWDNSISVGIEEFDE